MANRYATKSGNWSDVTVWDGGTTLPQAGDSVRPNGFTVTIDQSINITELRHDASSPAVAGGSFVWPVGITITGNIVGGGSVTTFVTTSGTGTRTLIGNITTNNSSTANKVVVISAGTFNMTGNVTGTKTVGGGVSLEIQTGVVATITGTVSSNMTVGSIYQAAAILLAGSCTLTGNVYGGPHGDSGQAINLSSGASITITGNIYGYPGYSSSALNNSNGTVELIGDLIADGGPAYQQTGASAVLYLSGNAIAGPNGATPFSNINYSGLRFRTGGSYQFAFRAYTGVTVGSLRYLYSGGTNIGQPIAANVRSGTVFGAASEYTGTLAVPSPSLVAIGVATDNTVGSYNPSVNASDIRNAIGLASANLDTQLSGISNKTTNLPSDPADQSLVEAAITSAVNSISTLIDSLPTNAELATALAAADDAVLAAIAALNNLSAAQVNAEILDVLSVDTFGELSAPPAATSSLKDKITWLFMWAKNKATETSTHRKLYADNSTTVVSTETVSDDGTTFTKTKAS